MASEDDWRETRQNDEDDEEEEHHQTHGASDDEDVQVAPDGSAENTGAVAEDILVNVNISDPLVDTLTENLRTMSAGDVDAEKSKSYNIGDPHRANMTKADVHAQGGVGGPAQVSQPAGPFGPNTSSNSTTSKSSTLPPNFKIPSLSQPPLPTTISNDFSQFANPARTFSNNGANANLNLNVANGANGGNAAVAGNGANGAAGNQAQVNGNATNRRQVHFDINSQDPNHRPAMLPPDRTLARSSTTNQRVNVVTADDTYNSTMDFNVSRPLFTDQLGQQVEQKRDLATKYATATLQMSQLLDLVKRIAPPELEETVTALEIQIEDERERAYQEKEAMDRVNSNRRRYE